jgi:hypothetical protein
VSDEESELDTLYAAPLDQFVKVRNEIVGRLKKDGDQEAAARIAALKKPSISAWAVNQLARTAALDLQRLIKAGEGLEQAQSRAMSGGDSTGFDAARRDEGAAISLVRTSAKKVLPSASATLLDRIVSTLRAGIATPEGRDLLKQGRLTEDIEPTGFGSFAGLSMPAAPKATAARKAASSKQQAKIESLRKRLQKADGEAQARETAAIDLEDEADDAEAVASKARKAADSARRRAESAAADAEKIRVELAELEENG